MASLLALTRAAPHLRFSMNLFDWTLVEAKKWVALMKHSTRSLTAASRAAALLDLARSRSAEAAQLSQEARRQFELVSARDRTRLPDLHARILLATEPSALRAVLPTILKAVRNSGPNRRPWLIDERMPEDARAIVQTWVDARRDWEVEPGLRLRLAARAAASAITLGRADLAAERLKEMTRWGPYCPYPASHLDVLRAARSWPSLHEACLGFVEVALTRERDAQARRALLRLRSAFAQATQLAAK